MVAHVASLLKTRTRTDASTPAPDPAHERLVDRIRTLNPSASREFLVNFRTQALELYLRHLAIAVQEPRGRTAVWVRPADTPGIVSRAVRD